MVTVVMIKNVGLWSLEPAAIFVMLSIEINWSGSLQKLADQAHQPLKRIVKMRSTTEIPVLEIGVQFYNESTQAFVVLFNDIKTDLIESKGTSDPAIAWTRELDKEMSVQVDSYAAIHLKWTANADRVDIHGRESNAEWRVLHTAQAHLPNHVFSLTVEDGFVIIGTVDVTIEPEA